MINDLQSVPRMVPGTPLHPFGIDLGPLAITGPAADPPALCHTVATHGVAVIRDVDISDEIFTAFLESLGPLMFTAGETPVPGAPALNIVSNVGRSRPPRSVFHTDTSYVSDPPNFTALMAKTVPQRGGQTLFSDQVAALSRLPRSLQQAVSRAVVVHRVTGVDPGSAQEHAARHPLVRRHPLTHDLALYLSTPERCAQIEGLSADRSARLIKTLYRWSTRAHTLYAHRWQRRDLVLWDNRRTMHRADHAHVVGDRVLHRGMAGGERPLPAF